MVKRTQFYQEIPENRKLIIQMLLSVISVCIEKEHFSVALKLLNYADRLKKPEIDFLKTLSLDIIEVIIYLKWEIQTV